MSTEAAPPGSSGPKGDRLGAVFATLAGGLYTLAGIAWFAIGLLVFGAFGHSLDHASAGSPEGAVGSVFLWLVGLFGGVVAAIGGSILAVGVVVLVLGSMALRDRAGATVALTVIFTLGAIAKVVAMVFMHDGGFTGMMLKSAGFDAVVAALLVRDLRRGR